MPPALGNVVSGGPARPYSACSRQDAAFAANAGACPSPGTGRLGHNAVAVELLHRFVSVRRASGRRLANRLSLLLAGAEPAKASSPNRHTRGPALVCR